MEYKVQEFCCRNSDDITELRSPQPDADEKSEVARLACRIHHSAKELRFCPKVESLCTPKVPVDRFLHQKLMWGVPNYLVLFIHMYIIYMCVCIIYIYILHRRI